jgi:hypothetical protein
MGWGQVSCNTGWQQFSSETYCKGCSFSKAAIHWPNTVKAEDIAISHGWRPLKKEPSFTMPQSEARQGLIALASSYMYEKLEHILKTRVNRLNNST